MQINVGKYSPASMT